jgi:hypothetical protein
MGVSVMSRLASGCVTSTITMFLITLLPYYLIALSPYHPILLKIDKKELHFRAHFYHNRLANKAESIQNAGAAAERSRPAMHTSFTDLKRNRS